MTWVERDKSGIAILHREDPTGYCGVCGEVLTGGVEAGQQHLTACAKRHIDEIRAAAPSVKHKGGPLDPETWDVEVEEHLKKVGQRMLKEGRLETRPNERAGFS